MDTIRVRHINGYLSLAAFMASDDDKSTSIYQRFDRLSARNLLYLQSELVELEAQQQVLDVKNTADLYAATEEMRSVRDWHTLKARAKEAGNLREKEQLRIALEIREKMKEYREALVLESTLLSIRRPSRRTLTAFRNVFNNSSYARGGFSALGGHSAKVLNDSGDLMALRTRSDEDRLTSFLRHYAPILFVTRRTDSRLVYISERRLQIAVAIVNLVLAAVLLFGAILNLYYVTDERKRLGLIAGYTIAFAMCVGLVTKARTSEVFAACAAYAAVLVVLVSGSLGNADK